MKVTNKKPKLPAPERIRWQDSMWGYLQDRDDDILFFMTDDDDHLLVWTRGDVIPQVYDSSIYQSYANMQDFFSDKYAEYHDLTGIYGLSSAPLEVTFDIPADAAVKQYSF